MKRWMMDVFALPMAIAALCNSGCGTWLGNPSKPEGGGTSQPPRIDVGSSTGGNTDPTLGPGEVMFQLVSTDPDSDLQASVSFAESALRLNRSSTLVELSLVGEEGRELAFARSGVDQGSIGSSSVPGETLAIFIKNNSDDRLDVADIEVTSGELLGDRVIASRRSSDPRNRLLMKAVFAFSSVCKQTTPDGNSTVDHQAPAGRAFIQPFVFVGRVNDAGKVEQIADAVLSITDGQQSSTLVPLENLSVSHFREFGGVSDDEHRKYTRSFYQGYFGAAGELYTTASFRKKGDCASEKTFAVADDPGKSGVQFRVQLAADGVDESYEVRPTASTAFSTYLSAGEKISDWTQCTYDRRTGDPTTYNGTASQCKEFKVAEPPYVKLDYLLPSVAAPSQYSRVSDPTRILFYGYSLPRDYYVKLNANAEALRSGTSDTIELDGCYNNGGLIAVPVSTDSTYIPLHEFNVKPGDIIHLARRVGSHTALQDFYQGNVDVSGEIVLPSCIPSAVALCDDFKQLKIKSNQCIHKADSGISVTALSQSFVYPDYFEMSGVIRD